MIAPQAIPQAPRRVPERPREAARRRRRRTRQAGYTMMARMALIFAVVLVPVMLYVMLMGNLTALNYSLGQEAQTKVALQDETMRLGDQVAHLESLDRLARVAAKLHMHDPHLYAVIALPAPAATPVPDAFAFLGTLFRPR